MGSYPVTAPQTIWDVPGLKGKNVTTLTEGGTTEFMESVIVRRKEAKEPFYVLDLGVVISLYEVWAHSLPMVHPFYAVKCNPEPTLLGVLAALGSSFDCASRAEIEAVLGIGVSPHRIVYANPCKAESHIKYAASVGVNLTTFDSVDEICKIRRWHPKSELLLRIKAPDDGGARCPLGPKYGALPEEVTPLLEAAQAADLNVTGVSFHIGSGATESRAYGGAIEAAKTVFETATRLGMPRMRILNIGGGFTANKDFDEAASQVKTALEIYFSNELELTIISEPGRFFAESAFTLVTNVIGKRVRGELREYWINDGIYGSMNCILYDHATITCTPLACSSNPRNPTCSGLRTYESTVFGPTCDALDTVMTGHQLPDLQVGDWLVFPGMGAYTAAAGSGFNGFNTAAIPTFYICPSPN